MFSRTERCGRRACRRSAGTSTTPARIASYGCRAFKRLARDADLAAVGADGAGERVEQLVLALALERGDAEHLAGGERERDAVRRRRGGQAVDLERRRLGRRLS